jgi:hypothetical protein
MERHMVLANLTYVCCVCRFRGWGVIWFWPTYVCCACVCVCAGVEDGAGRAYVSWLAQARAALEVRVRCKFEGLPFMQSSFDMFCRVRWVLVPTGPQQTTLHCSKPIHSLKACPSRTSPLICLVKGGGCRCPQGHNKPHCSAKFHSLKLHQ